MQKKEETITDLLKNIVEQYKGEISLNDLIFALKENGIAIILIILATPVIIPLPGISTIFGVPLLFFSFQLFIGYKYLWLPEFISKKKFNMDNLAEVLTKIIPYLEKAEKWIKPRFLFTTSKLGERILGFFCLVFSILITLPIIFGNGLPAIGIILIALGITYRDGFVIIGGVISGMIGLILVLLVVIGGYKFLNKGIEYFLSNF